jgi:hypothetical protein
MAPTRTGGGIGGLHFTLQATVEKLLNCSQSYQRTQKIGTSLVSQTDKQTDTRVKVCTYRPPSCSGLGLGWAVDWAGMAGVAGVAWRGVAWLGWAGLGWAGVAGGVGLQSGR